MAVLNYSGLLLAGKRVFQDIDQYEDDDADILDDEKTGGIDKKASYLYFKPLNEWETKKDWNVKMLEDESIECIASGSGWCACVTDKNWLRIFSQDGVQKQVLSQSSQIVTMVGYENLLAITYHDGLPIYDSQQIKMKIINCGGLKMGHSDTLYQTLYEGQCPVSKRSSISWMGFSEEGMLVTMDDAGVVQGFNFKIQQWIPILDLKNKYPETFMNVWIVGFMENEMLVINVPSSCEQPPLSLKSLYKREKLCVPLLSSDSQQSKLDEQMIREQFLIDHEQYRKDLWEPLKHFRGRYEPEKVLSSSILDAKEMIQKKKEFDKTILGHVKLCIENDEHEKIFTYLDLMNFKPSIKLALKLANAYKQNSLASKISQYITEKEQRAVLESTRNVVQSSNNTFNSAQMEMALK